MKKTIRDIDIKNKRVLIRCDFNVPIKDKKIIDDNRIVESLKTINYALSQNAKVILLSHLGRVKEESDLAKNDLSIVATRLSELLEKKVIFINETRGKNLEKAVKNMKNQDIVLIQNTRYEDLEGKKESSNDIELAKYWASLADVFINDAFGTIHRSHASNVGLANLLPNGVGFLVEKELINLGKLEDAEKPYIVILGGAKVKDKIGVIENLVTKADKILIGGGMAFTFLKAKGINIGKSLEDEESIEFCQKILKNHEEKIILPIDIHVAEEFNDTSFSHITPINEIMDNEIGMDIGPDTIEEWKNILKTAKTIVWNGPLGVYEMSKYRAGTIKILEIVTSLNAHTVLGGGDIVAAASEAGYKEKVSHASTGGGATLEYLEGKKLPGLECIREK